MEEEKHFALTARALLLDLINSKMPFFNMLTFRISIAFGHVALGS